MLLEYLTLAVYSKNFFFSFRVMSYHCSYFLFASSNVVLALRCRRVGLTLAGHCAPELLRPPAHTRVHS
jgi:hypothetical protein